MRFFVLYLNLIMKKFIYNLIRLPLIVIFLKTPLIRLLKKNLRYAHNIKNKNIFLNYSIRFFEKEYLFKLEDKYEIRKLNDVSLEKGEGRKWAEYYYDKHPKTLEELKKRTCGNLSAYNADPIYERIISFIKDNKLEEDKNTFMIQLGSSSGRDLDLFYKLFPNLNYISTEVNEEIIEFQKEKYTYPNLKFYKCYAEEINNCIDYFNIKDKNLIFFSINSLQYVNKYFISDFFKKIKAYNKSNLFIGEPISLSFFYNGKSNSDNRGNFSYSHKYDTISEEEGFIIIEKNIISPYSADNPTHGDIGHIFLHAKS